MKTFFSRYDDMIVSTKVFAHVNIHVRRGVITFSSAMEVSVGLKKKYIYIVLGRIRFCALILDFDKK